MSKGKPETPNQKEYEGKENVIVEIANKTVEDVEVRKVELEVRMAQNRLVAARMDLERTEFARDLTTSRTEYNKQIIALRESELGKAVQEELDVLQAVESDK